MCKIRYIDTFCWGGMHQQINASILKMLVMLYPGKIKYYAGSSQKKNVEMLFDMTRVVEYRSIYVRDGGDPKSILLRYIISCIQNIRFVVSSSRDTILIYNYDNPLSLFLMDLINRFYRRKILVFCHGEMELLERNENCSRFLKVLSWILRCYFYKYRKIQKDIFFCVLGDSILNNLKSIMTKEQIAHFVSVGHPYMFTKAAIPVKMKKDKFSLGTVGEFLQSKGAESFIELVKRFKNREDVSFSVTGSVAYGADKLMACNVSLPRNKGKGLLDSSEYERRIIDLDYILYLYPHDSYRLTASGAILDAVKFEKPIIAIRNNYFEYFFLKYGEIGYLVNDISEMEEIVLSILNNKMDIQVDFASIKQKLSPERISVELKSVLDTIIDDK